MVKRIEDGVIITAVWQKGIKVKQVDPIKYRRDECEAWMIFDKYGDRKHDYGWEIHHVIPVDQGGSDDLSNLIPLQWKNNLARGNKKSSCCVVTSEGLKNIKKKEKGD